MRLIVGLFLFAITSLPATPAKGEVEQFTRLERQWMDALAAKDEATLQRIMAPEFSIIGVGSQPDDLVGDRASWMRLALLREFPKHDVTSVRVTRTGDAAVVQCVLTADYPPKSLTTEGGRLQFLTTDVWVERDGHWQVLTRHSSLPRPPVSR